ncbi:TraR/DksA C4-type zinc finger protein [Desulfosporosinus hippei]|uniref:Transcriptional regulator, TraR/DksA family n=1 Tax=Desulfosporosinus hippei DSM 8344 TaxID=1121419 RepID=A0A1G7RPR0_9FIRM|nr:TraR/DksA C4-type zinc finger protein [Desulfosporosinus hippei]SDG12818.1 transcriptional regulator, TraR/DksA family [Desulfosporosinus hippei DSM 8344]
MKDQKRYDKLINTLHEERSEVMETAAELFEGSMKDSLGELSLVDNHPADVGSELYQRSRDIAEHDRLSHRIGAIDNALERFEKGNYAKCEHCGQQIPYERLEVLPYTTVCAKCSREEEKEEQHSLHREPVENEILNRPFSRTFNDGTDQVMFDGEDSWQAVARYGTADTLQDLGTNRNISDPNNLYEDSDESIGAVQFIETIETQREPEGRLNTIHYSKDHGQT